MPAYRPPHIEKKVFDVLKKKYKAKKIEKTDADGIYADSEEDQEEQPEDENEKNKFATKKFDVSKLKMNSFIPFMYNKNQKVLTLAEDEIGQIRKEREQRVIRQQEKQAQMTTTQNKVIIGTLKPSDTLNNNPTQPSPGEQLNQSANKEPSPVNQSNKVAQKRLQSEPAYAMARFRSPYLENMFKREEIFLDV